MTPQHKNKGNCATACAMPAASVNSVDNTHVSERIATYKNLWPLSYLSPQQMAEAGFSFIAKTKNGKMCDDVKCTVCGLEMSNWHPGDDPLKDHERYSTNCLFIRMLKNSQNKSDRGYDTCGSVRINSQPESLYNPIKSSLEKLGIQTNSAPVFPKYASYESRMSSFESWPITFYIQPRALSEAGFFYTGRGDQTVCFQCSGGLRDWEENDDPWVEHARWFSSCPYVKLVKGQEFIHEVLGYRASAQDNYLSLQELKNVLSAHTEVKPAPDMTKIEPSCSSETVPLSTANCTTPPRATSSQQSETSKDDGRLCKICYEREMGVVFLPCGHVVACAVCAATLTVCAVCRQKFTATVRAFLS